MVTMDPSKVSISAPRTNAQGEIEVLVTLHRDAEGEFTWIDGFHHDVDGALRTMRYLATKVRDSYDEKDQRGRKVLDSIERHLSTLEELKSALIDRVFPLER